MQPASIIRIDVGRVRIEVGPYRTTCKPDIVEKVLAEMRNLIKEKKCEHCGSVIRG